MGHREGMRTPTKVTAAALAAAGIAAGAIGSAGAGEHPVHHADVPLLSQAFAVAHAATAISRETDYYPQGLRADCSRKDYRRFDCRVRWRKDEAREHTGRMTVWLMRHQDRVMRWHYNGDFVVRDADGKIVRRYDWND